MELKNRTHGSKQFAEKTGMYRKIMPLKPLLNGIWLHPRFHRQADGGKPTF